MNHFDKLSDEKVKENEGSVLKGWIIRDVHVGGRVGCGFFTASLIVDAVLWGLKPILDVKLDENAIIKPAQTVIQRMVW